MEYKDITDLVSTLKSMLTYRDLDVPSDDILTYEVERAIAEINKCRRFEPTEDKLYDVKYVSLIIPLCLTVFSKIGAEGEISHSENGIVRQYSSGNDYPKDMLSSIIPLVK